MALARNTGGIRPLLIALSGLEDALPARFEACFAAWAGGSAGQLLVLLLAVVMCWVCVMHP